MFGFSIETFWNVTHAAVRHARMFAEGIQNVTLPKLGSLMITDHRSSLIVNRFSLASVQSLSYFLLRFFGKNLCL
jgi:hypothetical protein